MGETAEGPSAPGRRQVIHVDEAREQVSRPVVGTFHRANRNGVPRTVEEVDGVTGAQIPTFFNGEIGTRSCAVCEAADECLVPHPDAELETRNPGFGHPQEGGAHPPLLSDDCRREIYARYGKVVAESPGGKRPTELVAPPGVILRGICVDGFCRPAVDASVSLVVSDDVNARSYFAPKNPGRW
jgi:hypothetical protein